MSRDVKKEKTLEDELFYIGLAAMAGMFLGGVLYIRVLRYLLPPVPCFFQTFFGIYCPGCGGTRAVEALLHAHFLRAVWYHPFVPYAAFLYIGFMVSNGLNKAGVKAVRGWRYHNWYLYVGAAIIIVNFIVKNILKLMFQISLPPV
jgi:hypothetical protein